MDVKFGDNIYDSELPSLRDDSELVNDCSNNVVDENKNKTCEKTIYICDLCDQSFRSKRTLSLHMKNDRSPNHCFSNNLSKDASSHMSAKCKQIKKSGGKKTFACEVCSKQFSDQSNCRRHVKNHCHVRNNIHADKDKYTCNVCEKTFSRESNLRMHGRLHTGETPYKCEFCHLTFHRNDTLKTHRRVHGANFTQFRCDKCRKSFSSRSTLLRHVKMKHRNEKPYVCADCQQSFYRKHSLVVHLRSKHTGERPYECDVCRKSFMEKKVLVFHKKLH